MKNTTTTTTTEQEIFLLFTNLEFYTPEEFYEEAKKLNQQLTTARADIKTANKMKTGEAGIK